MNITAPPWHEFYLKDWRKKPSDVYRVALGNLIPERERKTFRLPYDPDSNLTRSIGFMDVTKRFAIIPCQDDNSILQEKEAMVIQTIGIEPKVEYERKGLARMLLKRAEELATEFGLDLIVAADIRNPASNSLLATEGYTEFNNGRTAFKQLVKQ